MIDASEAMLKYTPTLNGETDCFHPWNVIRESDLIFGVNAPQTTTHGLYKCLDMADANEFTISPRLV